MTEKEKMLSGLEYVGSDELQKGLTRARELCRAYNKTKFNLKKRKKLLQKIFRAKFDKIYIEPPFYVDFGENTKIGNNMYANFGLTILDCGIVEIGEDVMFGPNVQIYAVGHPIDPAKRGNGTHVGITKPITIGNNVWVGGNSTILMGVTIGDNSIIGAGSVVTKSIPANVVACGNPCKIIRKI